MNSIFKESFEDFINLTSYEYKTNNSPKIRDIDVEEYIIVRISNEDCKVLYLYSGASLMIPGIWLDMFSSFNIYTGDKILSLDINDLDNIDRLGCLFTRLTYYLAKGISSINGEEFLSLLGDIYEIRTKEFREWCKFKFKIDLDPLEYLTLDNRIYI